MLALVRRVIDAWRRLPAEGTVLLHIDRVSCAPPGYHLLGEKDQRLALSVDPAVNYSRSSIDLRFDGAALVSARLLPAPLLAHPNSCRPSDMADHAGV
ncbi:hypothetical protein [Hydrocarboniphaga sp.]|uniref:hypothetical protein n=1 Tax=Hydrocarboniphaga sp. TaxID=2033016 RepID=UPI003D1062D1